MEELKKELDSLKQVATKTIFSLFQEAGLKKFDFVDSHRRLTVSGDFENPQVMFVNDDKTTEDIKTFSVRDLGALIEHLKKILPTYQIKKTIYEVLAEQPIKPLDLPYFFYPDHGDTYRVLNITTEPYRIELYTPFYDEEKYEAHKYLSVWDITDADFLNRLYEVILQRLDADNFSMVPTEKKDEEVRRILDLFK